MSGQPALATRAGASACQARPRQWTVPLVLLLDDAAPGAVVLQEATDDGQLLARVTVQARDLPAAVAEREAARPRWVWDDTSRRYPALLAAGVRVERCHDLRLCHAILHGSALCADSALATAPPGPWDVARAEPQPVAASLFDDEPATVHDHLDVPEELARQLAAAVRGAVRADPGWRLVVADAAQLEPRVLAAMSGDGAMAAAGRQADLYQGVVDAGIVQTRKQAKVAMLGAIYGATTGASAVLMPQLTRAFPRAVGMVEAAARAGERGEVVSTWLGRSSPPPATPHPAAVAAASSQEAGPEDARAARGPSPACGRGGPAAVRGLPGRLRAGCVGG